MNARANAVYRDVFFLFRCFHRPPTPSADSFYRLQESRRETERAIERGAGRESSSITWERKHQKSIGTKIAAGPAMKDKRFHQQRSIIYVFSHRFLLRVQWRMQMTRTFNACGNHFTHSCLFLPELIWIFKGPAVIFRVFFGIIQAGELNGDILASMGLVNETWTERLCVWTVRSRRFMWTSHSATFW